MEYEWLEYELKNSPSLKLIRSDNVVFVVSFLVKQFKTNQKISIPESELENSLESYLELLRETGVNDYPKSAQDYLKDWCSGQYLRRTFEESDEAIFSLTSETEKVINWLTDLERKEFVGTESRFLQIVSLLKDMRDNTTKDPQERIRQLETEREQITEEINRIKETNDLQFYNTTKLKEWFTEANRLSQELLKDFAEVAQNFRELARKVQEAQLEQTANKGAIISKVLDADEALKNSDQGRSFYGFWDYLMSSYQKQELRELIDNVYSLEDLKELHQKYYQLRRLQSDLIKRSQSIIKSNLSLAEKLRQVLDEKAVKENRRVAHLVTDIQRLLLKNPELIFMKEDWLIWEENAQINLMMERELDSLIPEEKPVIKWEKADQPELNQEEIEELSLQFYLDENELLDRINDCLKWQPEISLAELTTIYPVEKGMSEIVAYLAIASQFEQHLINDKIESINIASLNPEIELELVLPQIIFRRDA